MERKQSPSHGPQIGGWPVGTIPTALQTSHMENQPHHFLRSREGGSRVVPWPGGSTPSPGSPCNLMTPHSCKFPLVHLLVYIWGKVFFGVVVGSPSPNEKTSQKEK